MALSATQMMRPSPYSIPPRFPHPINRPAYSYSHPFSPSNHHTNPAASAFFSATSQMLAPNVTLGTCALPITTANSHLGSPSPVLSPPHIANGLQTPPGVSESQRRLSAGSDPSPIQSSSPGPLGGRPEESLLVAQQLKPCAYHLMNGMPSVAGGGGAGRGSGMGLSPPLASCAHGLPLIAPHPHASATALMHTPAMYATATHPDYGPNGMNVNLPTTAGTACLPSALSMWNAYPPLPMPNGMMSPLPAGSLPKLTYDSPRYKLTPERAIPLIKWFEDHKDHPYPTRHEKMLLCQSTQLTFTQVSTWFANARRRMKKAICENGEDDKACSSDDSSSQKDTDSPGPASSCNRHDDY